jgi:hypothetical protein
VKAGLSREAKRRLGRNVRRVAQSWENRFEREAEKQFRADRRELLGMLRSAGDLEGARHAWGEYFGERGPERWRGGFEPLLRGLASDVYDTWEPFFTRRKAATKAIPETVFAAQAFASYLITFAQPIMETTNLDCVDIIQRGIENDWSVLQVERALGSLFNQYLDGGGLSEDERQWFEERLPKYRLENIGRTETMKGVNWASLATFGNFGATHKEWLATLDGRQRPDHEDAMARYSEGGNPGPIRIDEPFIVGGIPMMYPGDGPPAQACQCRCSVVPYSPSWANL